MEFADRAARNEEIFRGINERIEQGAEQHGVETALPFHRECGEPRRHRSAVAAQRPYRQATAIRSTTDPGFLPWEVCVIGRGQVPGRLDLSVRAEAGSLAQIRRALAEFLAEHKLDEQRRQDALLVVHELAANAIEHASARDDQVEVAVSFEPESLMIRVLDPARMATRPAALDPDQSRESGRGMLIVNQLASWNEQLTGDRREVTAQLPLRPLYRRACAKQEDREGPRVACELW